MIIHKLIPKKGFAIVTPEDLDDLWCLKRIINPENLVSGETTRAIKSEGFFSRPDKGERIKVYLTIKVDRIKLDNSFGRLKISGKIIKAPELMSKGSSHSLIITANRKLEIIKDKFNELEIRLLKNSEKETEHFVVIAIDRREAGIGVVQGTHLQILPTIESGLSGKRYKDSQKSITFFFDCIKEKIMLALKQSSQIFIAGPGHIKTLFMNYLSKQIKKSANQIVQIEGVDLSGEDGVILALRSPGLRDSVKNSKLSSVASLVEIAIKRISEDDGKVSFTFNETKKASDVGGIETAIISDKIFDLGVDEDNVADLLNNVDKFHGKSYLIDSSTWIGSQVNVLGGIIALLRFKI